MVNKNNDLQNKITKESIFTSLMILMEKKNFNDISVTEIAKKAGVSRMAFYRNYNLKEDIIINNLDEFFQEYSNQILSSEKINNYEIVCLYFAHFRKHERLMKNLNNSNLTYIILERCTGFLHSLFHDIMFMRSCSEEEDRYCIEFLAGGFYKVLIEWAKSGMKESDEDMAKILCKLIKE